MIEREHSTPTFCILPSARCRRPPPVDAGHRVSALWQSACKPLGVSVPCRYRGMKYRSADATIWIATCLPALQPPIPGLRCGLRQPRWVARSAVLIGLRLALPAPAGLAASNIQLLYSACVACTGRCTALRLQSASQLAGTWMAVPLSSRITCCPSSARLAVVPLYLSEVRLQLLALG